MRREQEQCDFRRVEDLYLRDLGKRRRLGGRSDLIARDHVTACASSPCDLLALGCLGARRACEGREHEGERQGKINYAPHQSSLQEREIFIVVRGSPY
jgi:hypothetical protein